MAISTLWTFGAAVFIDASAVCAAVACWAAGIEAIGRHANEWKSAAAESLVLEEDLFVYTTDRQCAPVKKCGNGVHSA
jgi:hypothetical protein